MTMKRMSVAVLAVVCCSSVGMAQMGGGMGSGIAAGSVVEPSVTFDALVSGSEKSVVGLAKAMPADKYGFAPSAAIFVPSQTTKYEGVRTFGAIVLHIAQANYGLGAAIGGMKPDIDPKSLADLKDKEQIVAALEASFAFVHKAVATLTVANAFQSVRGPMTRASMAGFQVGHTNVPPASEKK
jgi:hypothetical protein